MPDNPHRVVIDLEPSNGFSTKSHAHLADIVRRRLTELIAHDGVEITDMIRYVRIETARETP